MTGLGGKFIVLDGNEGCGKSTQAKMLRDRLAAEGTAVLLVRDPGSTPIGEQIRHILLDPASAQMGMRCEMLLYMAARAQMFKEIIQPALAAGQVVISDRFISSTMAYQLGGDGLTAEQICAVADISISGHWPDLTIILDLPVTLSSQRATPKYRSASEPTASEAKKDRIEMRPVEYHEQVRQNFLRQAQHDPAKYRIIDASRSVEEVHVDVWSAIEAFVSRR